MIEFKCPTCGKGIKADERMAGKRGKCPGCGNIITMARMTANCEIAGSVFVAPGAVVAAVGTATATAQAREAVASVPRERVSRVVRIAAILAIALGAVDV